MQKIGNVCFFFFFEKKGNLYHQKKKLLIWEEKNTYSENSIKILTIRLWEGKSRGYYIRLGNNQVEFSLETKRKKIFFFFLIKCFCLLNGTYNLKSPFKRSGNYCTVTVFFKKQLQSKYIPALSKTPQNRKISNNHIENVQQQCLVNTSVQSIDMTAKTDRREDAFDSQCVWVILWVRWQQQVTN